MSVARPSSRPQLRLALPPRPIEEVQPAGPDEAPFFRPKSRTRVRRPRRGLLARAALLLELVAAAVLLVSGAWAGYSKVLASEKLRVAKVDVRGEKFLSEGEVVQLLGPALGENILMLDLAGLKAKLRASPWVADATVTRTLPDTLNVEVRERLPLALAEVDRLYLMDGDGNLIDIYGPRTSGFDLPIVRGLSGTDAESRRDRAQRAGALLRDLADLGAEVSEVQVEDSGDLRLVLRSGSEVLRMGAPPYRKRFATFLGMRQELRARCPNVEYFDLRYRDRIYAMDAPAPKEPAAAAKPARTGTGEPHAPAPPAKPAQARPTQGTGESAERSEGGRG